MNHMLRSVALLSLFGCNVTLTPTCSANGQVVVDEHDDHRSQGGAAAGACPGPVRSGTTDCFPSTCSAGQYCDDTVGSGECRPGCVSDSNCGSREVCVRPDGAALGVPGRCESCSGRTFDTAIDGCIAPDRSGTTACFPGECPVGQYCIDGALPHCEPGCVSDENCGPAERCERGDGSVRGMCSSCFASHGK